MEKVIDKKLKSRFSIHVKDIVCACISIVLGSVSSPIGFVLTFVFITYSYLKDVKEAGIVVCLVLLFSFERGLYTMYLYALGFAVYFFVIHMLKVLNQNIYQWLAYTTTMISAAISLQYYGLREIAVIMPLLSYTLLRVLLEDFCWVNKRLFYPSCIRGMFIFALALFLLQYLPLYTNAILMLAFVCIAYTSDVKTTMVLALTSYFFISPSDVHILTLAVLLCTFKYDKKSTVLIIIGAAFLFPSTIEMYLYLLLCLSGLCFVNHILQHSEARVVTQTCMEEKLSQNSLLKRQMYNYANIFQSLSAYYAQINNVQSEILENMANALQYNADAIRKVDIQQDGKRIQNALEGYQYDVTSITIDEPKEDCVQMDMEIANIKRGEIRATLLPIIEGLLHRNFAIEEIVKRKFQSNCYQIRICDYTPYVIDTYADSIKNSYTSSGDSFSIFKFRQSVICMISDGMGNGERAAQSSRLITNILQRMIVSGVQQDSAITCINKLIQSDTFATLDVICFNRSKNVAYISKSAACPTFLLRNKEVYEIHGNALPVGIISQMQPDCFEVELQRDDEYLMVSDGIYISEIYAWLKIRTGNSVKEDVEQFTQLLQKKRREDDSTIILAKVNENI